MISWVTKEAFGHHLRACVMLGLKLAKVTYLMHVYEMYDISDVMLRTISYHVMILLSSVFNH